MPISGLLLTLSQETSLQRQTFAALATRPEVELGSLVDHWLPIAIDVTGDDASRTLHDWILSLPGVVYVDVVYVNFEETPGAELKVNIHASTVDRPLNQPE